MPFCGCLHYLGKNPVHFLSDTFQIVTCDRMFNNNHAQFRDTLLLKYTFQRLYERGCSYRNSRDPQFLNVELVNYQP